MNRPLNISKAITMIELIVSMLIVSIVVLSFYSMQTFSHGQVVNSERRSKIQNELTYAIEHMSKYVHQAVGNMNNHAIVSTAAGFKVRVDLGIPQTPSSLVDTWITYTLSGNTLSVACSGSVNCPFVTEELSNRIIDNFVADTLMPINPANGFYVKVDPLGALVDIGLVGRYNPLIAYSALTKSTNPQVEIKTKVICSNCSVN